MDPEQNYQPIPFFVVDRPMSLRILEFCKINEQSFTLGLMGHANTSLEFQAEFRNFNKKNVKKIVDSGVFTKNGCMNGYPALFSTYENMGADYGIMIDILKDKEKTIVSAQNAIDAYKKREYPFELIGVAQGNTIQDYLDCYQSLKDLEFKYIAIGGLLKKAENTARYVKVHDEKFLVDVVSTIRDNYPKDWLFLLGSYHPRRHHIFRDFRIFGGDYKGWIFQYIPPEDWIKKEHLILSTIEANKKEQIVKEELNQTRAFLNFSLHSKEVSLEEKNEYREKIKEIDREIIELRERKSTFFGEEYINRLNLIKTIYDSTEKQLRDYRFAQVRNYIESQVYSNFRRRLLIIGCSNKKNRFDHLDTALNVYDGPNYRSIKKMIRSNNFPDDVQILIISAKYGMIFPDELIGYYDQKMTAKQSELLRSEMKKKLKKYVCEKNFSECFINLGKTYRDSIQDFTFPDYIIPKYAEGKIGEKRSEMLQWLKN
jgi:hypothetical protein